MRLRFRLASLALFMVFACIVLGVYVNLFKTICVTEGQANKVQVGMTKQEVETILGPLHVVLNENGSRWSFRCCSSRRDPFVISFDRYGFVDWVSGSY